MRSMRRLPISGWVRMIFHSSGVSGPGLRRIASGMPIFPMSWRRTPCSRSSSWWPGTPWVRALGGDQELLHVHRLEDEVVGAVLQALDGGLHVADAGEDDDRRVRILLTR